MISNTKTYKKIILTFFSLMISAKTLAVEHRLKVLSPPPSLISSLKFSNFEELCDEEFLDIRCQILAYENFAKLIFQDERRVSTWKIFLEKNDKLEDFIDRNKASTVCVAIMAYCLLVHSCFLPAEVQLYTYLVATPLVLTFIHLWNKLLFHKDLFNQADKSANEDLKEMKKSIMFQHKKLEKIVVTLQRQGFEALCVAENCHTLWFHVCFWQSLEKAHNPQTFINTMENLFVLSAKQEAYPMEILPDEASAYFVDFVEYTINRELFRDLRELASYLRAFLEQELDAQHNPGHDSNHRRARCHKSLNLLRLRT